MDLAWRRPTATSSVAAVPAWAVLALVNAVILGLALSYVRFSPRVYESTFSVRVASSQSKVTTHSNDAGATNVLADEQPTFSANQYDAVAFDRELLYSVAVTETAARALGRSRQQLLADVQAKSVSKAGLLEVSVRGSDPRAAQRAARVVLQALLGRSLQLREAELESRRARARAALERADADVRVAARKLVAVQSRTGVFADGDYAKQMTGRVAELQAKRDGAAARIAALETQIASLRARTASGREPEMARLRLTSYLPYKNAQQDLARVDRELSDARTKYTNENPAVVDLLDRRNRALQRVVSTAKAALSNRAAVGAASSGDADNAAREELVAAETQLRGVQAEATAYAEQLNALNGRVATVPGAEREVAEARRQAQIAQAVFDNALASYQSALLDRSTATPEMQIFDRPSLPASVTSPRPKVVFAGAGALAAIASFWLLTWSCRRPLTGIHAR